MKDLNNKKIFIECSPGVGDLVVLSPILRALKERYPSCILTIMSKRNSLHVIERLPYVDHICPMDEGTKVILKKMWRQDYVIFINYKPLLFALAKLIGVPHRIGPCKEIKSGDCALSISNMMSMFLTIFINLNILCHIFVKL